MRDHIIEPDSEFQPDAPRDRFALEVLQHAVDEAEGQVTGLGADENREYIIEQAKLFLMRLGPHKHGVDEQCQICYFDTICGLAQVDSQWAAEKFRKRWLK